MVIIPCPNYNTTYKRQYFYKFKKHLFKQHYANKTLTSPSLRLLYSSNIEKSLVDPYKFTQHGPNVGMKPVRIFEKNFHMLKKLFKKQNKKNNFLLYSE